MEHLRLLLHDSGKGAACQQVLDAIAGVDPTAPLRRSWDSTVNYLETKSMGAIDVLIDVLGDEGRAGLCRLQQLWRLRVSHNHSIVPVYFALSRVTQPPALVYEIRRQGGRIMHVADIPAYFGLELEQIQLELSETKRGLPRWEIILESFGLNPMRAYIFLRFGGKVIEVEGSDRQLAVLAVLLKNNGIPRSMNVLQQLCSEDPLFCPAGGPFTVPQRGTLKMYLYRDFPRHLQRAFDAIRSGYCTSRVIQHVDLDTKAMGYRIRGLVTTQMR
jgi:hypothetical protein